MKPTLLFLCALGLFLTACKTKKYTLENLPEKRIVFGEGGGFTGNVTSYYLLENGQCFLSTTTPKNAEELPKVKKKTTKRLFAGLDSLNFYDLQLDAPFNVYYFIEGFDSEKNNKIIWGSPDVEVSQNLTDYYNSLIQNIKK